MSVTTATSRSTVSTSTSTSAPALWRAGLVAAILASVATEVLAGIVRASGVHLAVGNMGGTAADVVELNVGACTIMVFSCVAAGLTIAAGLNRWTKRPAHTFQVTAYALTALSVVPDIFAGATAASTKVTLISAHLVAAAIVIPLVSRSLKTER
jgi:hypothetical protein